jgi:hypothetical protein
VHDGRAWYSNRGILVHSYRQGGQSCRGRVAHVIGAEHTFMGETVAYVHDSRAGYSYRGILVHSYGQPYSRGRRVSRVGLSSRVGHS